MDKNPLLEKNLLALSGINGELSSRLAAADSAARRYEFLESRSGETIPAWVDSTGKAHPLHSTIDPRKEADRLINSLDDSFFREGSCFLVILGLGGAYYAEAALKANAGMVLVIEYGLSGVHELLCRMDYSCLFNNPRFRLLVNSSNEEIERNILNLYQPVLYGGIKVIPLRSRTSLEPKPFQAAGDAIESAIKRVSADYSVQAHFGKRWASNIVKNLEAAGENRDASLRIRRAAVTAAGPSLMAQIRRLKERQKELFIIATDTSLSCLLNEGIRPGAVISIDCQHISYYHFMEALPDETILFLDLASPPLLSSRAKRRVFFSGSHPLGKYISRVWKALPELDASGGNVTYAAISLAEQLGAEEIELYGADFSYPKGVTYARGTYIYSFFGKKQSRLSPLEAQHSSFLYRTPLDKRQGASSWYYETEVLRFYREKLEEKSLGMDSLIIPVEGAGAAIQVKSAPAFPHRHEKAWFPERKEKMGREEFLKFYRGEIARLPQSCRNAAEYIASLDGEERAVLATLLPAAAAFKKRSPAFGFKESLTAAKDHCQKVIYTVLAK